MEQEVSDKSPMEIAMEYIAANPTLTELEDAAFQAFWDYPEECIAQHKSVLYMMKTSFGFSDEMIENLCKDYLADSCKYVADLKAEQARNGLI